MAPKIFITGATGYIGGDALYTIATAHPDWEIAALVRSTDKAAKVAAQHPQVRFIYGLLDDLDIIEHESSIADVVGDFASADHGSAVQAILKGLARNPRHASDDPPGFLIHVSGTGNLMHEDLSKNEFGTAFSETIHDDLEGVGKVTSLPDSAPHRGVEKLVLGAQELYGSDRVRTAIVSPPAIYGPGRGPDARRSVQIPELVRVSLERGQAVRVNEGKTYWGFVHVHDLSELFLKLFEEAVSGGSTAEWPGKPDVWGPNGYFFAENGEHSWGEVSQWVADEGKKQGFFESDEVKPITAEEANSLSRFSHALWGANSRSRAHRAKEVLRWKPTAPSARDEVRDVMTLEAKKLGLIPGNAKVAAGDA